ncbi:pyridoxine 5'-phosphate synthase, partial [Candidatus Poribacteria bacterium]|nr:pyridoxine 5'-phosphate synthase [Candidatus Poribacteria bacterium]
MRVKFFLLVCALFFITHACPEVSPEHVEGQGRRAQQTPPSSYAQVATEDRPDERHIKQQDVYDLKPLVKTELNIEGYPTKEFMGLVMKVKPAQVTLVPDPPDVLTSN